ncbi:MAG TPA: cupin domain-containing protein [Candidatus Dormibacteraeota bacterium]|jgi:quercetin dioxygenase-like cupin family protein|nr:cupin domain-containing protein [Candidatus Dormibacteraeota bacterium]
MDPIEPTSTPSWHPATPVARPAPTVARGNPDAAPTVARLGPDRVVESPATGERIVLLWTGAETGGRLLSFELFLAPGGHVPAAHAHPEQEERFTVLEGLVRFRVGTRSSLVTAGRTVVVPPGTAHHFANLGRRPAHLVVEVRPALGMEELLRTAAALSSRPGWGRLRTPLDLVLFLQEFERELGLPYLPTWLGRATLRPLARLVRAVGWEAGYRSLRGRSSSPAAPSASRPGAGDPRPAADPRRRGRG